MFSFHQCYNYIASKTDYLLGRERCIGHPRRLYLELTNHCNLRCKLCPTGRRSADIPQGYMDSYFFKSIIDTYGKYAHRVSFHNWGEPLLHPNIVEFTEYALKAGVYVKFSTNLVHLPNQLAQGLVRSRLPALTVSIPAGIPETYRTFTEADCFHLVLEHLRTLVQIKQQMQSSKPRITWFYVVNRLNENEIDTATKLSERIGVDHFVTIPVRAMPHNEMFLSNEDRKARYGEWIPKSDQYNRYLENAKRSRSRCSWPWERLVFDWDGSIYPCCLLYGQKSKLHDTCDYDVSGVWNSEPFRLARRACLGVGMDKTACDTCYRTGFTDFL